MKGHALVIGATSMLRGACLELAAAGWTVTAVARRHEGLLRLREEAGARTGRSGAVNAAAADYRDIGALAQAIRQGAADHGPITLAVCYIHSDAPMAPIVVADLVGNPSRPCTYVHIVGSMAPDELRIDASRDEILSHPGIRYRRVILGFVVEGRGSRWLSDEEICAGVLRAVEDSSAEQVVGVVSPWDRRPGEPLGC